MHPRTLVTAYGSGGDAAVVRDRRGKRCLARPSNTMATEQGTFRNSVPSSTVYGPTPQCPKP